MDIAGLKAKNAARWQAAIVTPALLPVLKVIAGRLVNPVAKDRYEAVTDRVGAPPWWLIAVIHEREASQSWAAYLGNGDPLSRTTIHVPRGRGPFAIWEDGAVDALSNCAPYAAKWTNWTIGGLLTLLEEYNGLGYAMMGQPSPYVWASTNQYVRGKYIADGHYDPNAVDTQLGCTALLKTMAEMDQTIKIGE